MILCDVKSRTTNTMAPQHPDLEQILEDHTKICLVAGTEPVSSSSQPTLATSRVKNKIRKIYLQKTTTMYLQKTQHKHKRGESYRTINDLRAARAHQIAALRLRTDLAHSVWPLRKPFVLADCLATLDLL